MKTITIFVETPKGSGEKYDYNEELRCFKLNKILPAGMVFPFDFGYIPNTKGADGDPLDIIVISEVKTFTGCAIDCRIIGAIKAEQTEKDGVTVRNDRFIGVSAESVLYKDTNSIFQLPQELLQQLEDFFKNYNKASDKKFKVLERLDSLAAYQLIP